jgi:diguanylate cyclase
MSPGSTATHSPHAEALPKPPRQRHITAASEQRPSHRSVAGAHRDSSQPASARPGVAPVLAGLTIVVVDDDPDSLDYFGMALRAAGAAVIAASNAPDALRTVREQRPNVVLSDIAMKEHDGYWLLREIRRTDDEAVSRLPVIATTAFGREHSQQRTLAAGFNDHLQKPVLPETLWQAMAKAASAGA